MRSRWNDADARAAIETHGRSGASADVALRVYTTRLLGGDPLLVLHGGGNTSVKTVMEDLTGASEPGATSITVRTASGRQYRTTNNGATWMAR